MLCESCDNTFPLETIQQLADGEQGVCGASGYDWETYVPRSYEDTGNVNLADYSCPSCGAEISGDDSLGSTVCPYCGNSTIVKGQISYANIPVDGSKKADDTYMEAVEPFNYNDAVEFNGAYLSGYLADKYDVTAEESIKRANERVKNSTIEAFRDTTGLYTAVIPDSERVEFENGKIRYSLLPVWMLLH